MTAALELRIGSLLKTGELRFDRDQDVEIAHAVGAHIGAEDIELRVVRLDPGATWNDREYTNAERVYLVFGGFGRFLEREETTEVVQGSAAYSASGSEMGIAASPHAGMTLYVWSTSAPLARGRGVPKSHGSLWDSEVQLTGFRGVSDSADSSPARMNFVFWPGSGSPKLSLHCGIQESGQTFNVHVHPHSEEAFIVFEGRGQMHLAGQWHDVEAGDILFAPPGVPHGARNPHASASARRFVTCGGPTPFDPQLYEAAGVSAEVL